MVLSEPSATDDTYANRQEHPFDWLVRSTTHRAVECRRFLNEHLGSLDPCDQERVIRGLRDRWDSAFFELIVARVLQLLGASITFEVANPDGRHPDFRAVFDDGPITVEAAVPRVNREVHATATQTAPLMDIIEQSVPDGWAAGVFELPHLGPRDSKRRFKRAVRELLDGVAPPSGGDDQRLLVAETADGPVEIMLIPRHSSDGEKVLCSPGGSFADDTESRIIHTVNRKRAQVRSCDLPVVLAIYAGGLLSRFEHFDMALFGHSYSRYGIDGELEATGFRSDGIFGKPRSSRAPTYAAILAFVNVGFSVCEAPVLYLHPRYKGPLPEPLSKLERRSLQTDGQGICVVPAASNAWLSEIHLVSADS